LPIDGLLVVDKPAGLTSHEVVACVRRALDERRVGHTGTLDPAATGVLVLVLGRATRLARFLSGDSKGYETAIRLGVATDTYDADGTPLGSAHTGEMPTRETIDRALDEFRGTFLQRPPAFSAKKIDGTRSYRLARRARREQSESAPPPAASVTAHAIEIISVAGDTVTVRVECSAGFYVRSLVHDLGSRLGIGAHVTALRRTHNGSLTLDQSVDVETLARDPEQARKRVIPLAAMLSDLASVTLTAEGIAHAVHGRRLGPGDTARAAGPAGTCFIRMLDAGGDLVGIARPADVPGFLHPSVVLK